MALKKTSSLCAVVALLSGLVACSARAPAEGKPASEEIGTQSAAVQNGDPGDPASFAVTYNSVTGKPCSGTIVQKLDGWTGVLTARECVTTDGTSDSPLASLSDLYIYTAGSWYSAGWLDAAPQALDCARNVAVLWVGGEVGNPSRFGMCLGEGPGPSSLEFWGFGADWTLRGANSFSTTMWSCPNLSGYCAFQADNAGNSSAGVGVAYLVAANSGNIGDEGALGLTWPSGSSAPAIAGIGGRITSTNICGAAAPGFGKFVQDALFFYFASPFTNLSYNLCANGEPPVDTGWVYGRCPADGSGRSRIDWYPDTKEIKFWNTNLCWQPESGYLRIRTCTGASEQKWTVAHDSTCAITIQNVASGECINDTGYEWPSMGSCGDLSAKYLWHTMP